MPPDPQWYTEMIDLARGLGRPQSEVEQLITRGASAEPSYQHMYSAAARYLTPRWYGQPGEWESFAERTAERLGVREGSVVYGHVALEMNALYGVQAFLAENRIHWDRLKQSLADREALYGIDLHAMNSMALIATSVNDNEYARALFTRVGDDWDPAAWPQRRYFDAFRQRVSE